MTLIEILLALFLPPLAVALKKGLSRPFWITVVLTLLGHVPGVIYALMVTTAQE